MTSAASTAMVSVTFYPAKEESSVAVTKAFKAVSRVTVPRTFSSVRLESIALILKLSKA